MFKRIFEIGLLLLGCLTGEQTIAQDKGDASRRINEFISNASKVNELCSFDASYDKLIDDYGTWGSICIYQKTHRSLREQRAEMLRPIGDKNLRFTMPISFLALPGFQATGYPTSFPVSENTEFFREEVDKEQGQKSLSIWPSQMNWDPCSLAICDGKGNFNDVNDVPQGFLDRHILDVLKNEDGTTTIAFLGDNKTWGHEVVFSNEPNFLPIKVIARFAISNPAGPRIATNVEEFREWKGHSETSTKWISIGNVYVPEMIEFQRNSNHNDVHKRLLFSNWKFGSKVEASVLSKETMTDEYLRKLDVHGILDRVNDAVKPYELMARKNEDSTVSESIKSHLARIDAIDDEYVCFAKLRVISTRSERNYRREVDRIYLRARSKSNNLDYFACGDQEYDLQNNGHPIYKSRIWSQSISRGSRETNLLSFDDGIDRAPKAIEPTFVPIDPFVIAMWPRPDRSDRVEMNDVANFILRSNPARSGLKVDGAVSGQLRRVRGPRPMIVHMLISNPIGEVEVPETVFEFRKDDGGAKGGETIADIRTKWQHLSDDIYLPLVTSVTEKRSDGAEIVGDIKFYWLEKKDLPDDYFTSNIIDLEKKVDYRKHFFEPFIKVYGEEVEIAESVGGTANEDK